MHIAEKKNCLFVSNFLQGGERIDYRRIVSFEAMQTASWSGEMKQLIEDLEEYKRLQEKNQELFHTTPPSLNNYYKNKVNDYFFKF
jgi:hypothetical protein